MSKITRNERIICAAIKVVDTGKVYYGHRHSHCISAMNGELSWELNRKQIGTLTTVQGFITSEKRFVDRVEAFVIAQENNQIINPNETRGTDLYSEDLY